jgi:hypothetical protein
MKSQRTIRGQEARLGLVLLAVTFTSVAVAQPDGEAAKAAAPPVGSAEAAEPAKAATAEPAKVAADATADGAAQKSEAATAVAAPMPDTPAPVATAAEPEPAAATPLSVEILPGSGYPEPKVRGIVGGSLWLTMHGLQFPYLGPETSKQTVRIAISGSVWDDTAYARINSGTDIKSTSRWTNQARAVLRATPTYTTRNGWFAGGQVEVVAKGDQTATSNMGMVDDAFVRAGKWKLFDVTVGRFQGWEVYHYGMGLDLNTYERRGAEHPDQPVKPPQIYGLSNYWDRPDGGAGNYAAHVYFTDYLRLEVLGQIGTNGGGNTRATRPVLVLDLGYVKAKVGVEYGVVKAQLDDDPTRTKRNGIGGALQFVLDPHIEGGINAAVGYTDVWNIRGLPELRMSTTTKSFGGFLNGRVIGALLVGVGVNYTHLTDLDENNIATSPNLGQTNYWTHLQSFGAVQYSFWDKLSFKFVAGYAKFHFEDKLQNPAFPYDNTAYSGRLRMMYLF